MKVCASRRTSDTISVFVGALDSTFLILVESPRGLFITEVCTVVVVSYAWAEREVRRVAGGAIMMS